MLLPWKLWNSKLHSGTGSVAFVEHSLRFGMRGWRQGLAPPSLGMHSLGNECNASWLIRWISGLMLMNSVFAANRLNGAILTGWKVLWGSAAFELSAVERQAHNELEKIRRPKPCFWCSIWIHVLLFQLYWKWTNMKPQSSEVHIRIWLVEWCSFFRLQLYSWDTGWSREESTSKHAIDLDHDD